MKTKTDVAGEGYCVCCPRCGKVLLRSVSMDSVMICGRCGFKSYANVDHGAVFITDARYVRDDTLQRQVGAATQTQGHKEAKNRKRDPHHAENEQLNHEAPMNSSYLRD